MSSLNPAKVLKIDHHKGSILEGKDADIVVLADDYEIEATFIEGDLEYKRTDQYVYHNTKMMNYMTKTFD